MAQHRQNVYTSVLLREGYPLTDLLAGSSVYLGPLCSVSAWHLNHHYLPSVNFNCGGGPAIWLAFPFYFF
jgi:hypothetical protein